VTVSFVFNRTKNDWIRAANKRAQRTDFNEHKSVQKIQKYQIDEIGSVLIRFRFVSVRIESTSGTT